MFKNKHPFLVNLEQSFQTEFKFYIVMPFYSGGEMFVHVRKSPNKFFPEIRAKFYAAQIILALEFLHQNKILYRDLKLENVLLDSDGNAILCDFGLSKWKAHNQKEK